MTSLGLNLGLGSGGGVSDPGAVLLAAATARYSASSIVDGTEQVLPNLNGAGEMQRGSTTGVDADDPVALKRDGGHYYHTTDTAGANYGKMASTVPAGVSAFTVLADIKMDDYSPGSNFRPINGNVILEVSTAGTWTLFHSDGTGFPSATATAATIGTVDGDRIQVRIDIDTVADTADFYSRPYTGTHIESGSWGTAKAEGVALSAASAGLKAGANSMKVQGNGATAYYGTSDIYHLSVTPDGDSVPLYRFDPGLNASVGAGMDGWIDGTTTVTFATPTSGLRSTLVTRPVLLFASGLVVGFPAVPTNEYYYGGDPGSYAITASDLEAGTFEGEVIEILDFDHVLTAQEISDLEATLA